MKALTGSLRWRLYLLHVLLLMAILGIAGVLVYSQVQNRLISNRLTQIRETVSWALTNAEPLGSIEVHDMNQVIESLSESPTPDFSFFLLDSNGELVRPLGQGKPRFIKIPVSLADLSYTTAASETIEHISKVTGDQYRTLTSIWPVFDSNDSLLGAVQSEVRLDETDIALSQLVDVLILGFSLIFVAASGLWLFLTRAVLRPLEDLARVSAAVNASSLESRVPVPRIRDEAYRTTVAFNNMLDSLQAYISREKETKLKTQQFLTDASHELRTPLTVLRGYLDVLRRGVKDDPKALENALETMHATVDKMVRLTNDLLDLSRLDLGRELNIEVVELNSLCQSTVEAAQVMVKDRQLDFQPGPTAEIRGDTQLLEQVLWNLLDNAIRHTATNGKIVVRVNRQDLNAYITVQDDGEGISPEHLPRIFDRFYRADPTRPGGAGLGLAIVKAIIEAHNGEITLQSTPGSGTTVTIVFPLSS
jgi:two-component system OmpR family sensor kinase